MVGLIKMGHLKNKPLLNNGDWRTQTAEKPTVLVTLDETQRQYVSGGNNSFTSVYIVCIIYT